MSPLGFAVLSLLLYGIANSVIEHYLKTRISPLIMIIITTSSILTLSVMNYLTLAKSGSAPVLSSDWRIVVVTIVVGLVLFYADYMYLTAYERGGNAFVVTSVFIMLPVAMAVVQFAVTRTWPTFKEVAGFVLAAGSILLLRK